MEITVVKINGFDFVELQMGQAMYSGQPKGYVSYINPLFGGRIMILHEHFKKSWWN